MPIRYNKLQKNTYYHIFNRGYNKQQLFFSPEDYQRFYDTIARYKISFPSIRIESFCFLPNHFHFLLIDDEKNLKSGLKSFMHSPIPDLIFDDYEITNDNPSKNISNFMGKIQQSYAMYFNRKYGESVKQGLKSPVFEGRFKAKIIADQDYLEMIRYYVENNAVKHGLVDNAEDWGYSSFDISRETVEYSDEFNPYFE